MKNVYSKLEMITRAVTQMGMFSENESYKELDTSHLRYLLLPAYMAWVVQRMASIDRLEQLSLAEVL